MGLGSTIKNILSDNDSSSNTTSSSHTRDESLATGRSTNSYSTAGTDASTHHRAHLSDLPPGTGPGTSGKPATSSSTTATTGHHVGDNVGVATTTGTGVGSTNHTGRNVVDTNDINDTGIGHHHTHGHPDKGSQHIMPGANAHEDSTQLNPVTHEHVRHIETEEVERQREHHRNIHHVQHHVVPVAHREEIKEEHHHKVHPVTHVHEKHANNDQEVNLLDGQVQQHQNRVEHAPVERHIIDKGTVTDERIHHHVHNVVQPVIEKETVNPHRIHTVIPVHETTHEAPIIHESVVHAPVGLDKFLAGGGTHTSGLSPAEMKAKVLNGQDCDRTVQGNGEDLARELGLGASGVKTHSRGTGNGNI